MLLGRRVEQARIDELLAAADAGHSGCLVLTGDPGIGKSALLGYAQERADGATVLAARGYESESQIPFAGLSDLLRPVLHLLPRLPGPQAAALAGALSLGPPVAGDRFSVCAATVGMLAAAAEDAPVLVLVDDVHWLDGSSREALLFAARRLHGENIAMVLASRVVDRSEIDYAGVRQIRLSALAAAEAEPLLGELAPGAPAELRRQIYEAAAGNPLGILELCGQWARSSDSVHPAEVLATPSMPADSRLTRALGARLDGLPERTIGALMLVAASAGAGTDLVVRAAQLSGLNIADFAPAEEAQLLVIEDRRIVFRHPLLRSVLYGAASTHARGSAHSALASALADVPGEVAEDARAWHLAAARFPPDEQIATLLATAGARSRQLGGHGEAARAFEQAARFAGPEQRPVLLLRASRCWQLAGRSSRVLPLLEEALPLARDPRLRGVIRHMDAYVRMWRRSPVEGLDRIVDAAREVQPDDPQRAALMNADAGIACFMLGRIDRGVQLVQLGYDLAQSLDAVAPVAPVASPERRHVRVAQLVSAIALAGGLATQGRRAEARRLLAEWGPELDTCDPLSRAQELAHACFVAIWLEDYDQAERWLDRVSGTARQVGALGVLPQTLSIYAELYFRTGRWAQSRAAGVESVSLAAESREGTLYSRLFMARLDGLQGRDDACRVGIDSIRAVVRRVGADGLEPHLAHLEGLLALGRGDTEDAVRRLEAVRAHPTVQQMPEQGVLPWAYDLVEAYLRAGRVAEARDLLEAVAPDPGDAEHRWSHAAAARCRGLLAAGAAASTEFERALTVHERADQPFERARTLLAFGERLRRERQRAASRTYLRPALETFEKLGAVAWADRARAELTATGEALTRGTGVVALLTPQELQVAMVVARGASNAEAAAALFLSPKTIEYHLSNVYRKSGLRSRADLSELTAPS